MIFILGLLSLVGSLAMTSALLPCVCQRHLRPVCGSDGQTYNNECLLNCAAITNPDLHMARSGSCDGQQLGPPRYVRNTECRVCPYIYLPVCGTDGHTYSSHCEFECAKRSADIEIAHDGDCRAKRESESDHVGPHGEVNCLVCPAIYSPICGTDGKTYANGCIFTCTRGSDTVVVAHYGDCENKRETREISHRDTRDAECAVCPFNYSPICGTDGITYPNDCAFKCTKRSADTQIAYYGDCRNSEISHREIRDTECRICPAIYSPVCGTDGITYPNDCTFNCAKRSAPIEVAHYGACKEKRETVQVAELSKPSRCTCPRNFAPVCGNDGTTYDNPCILDCFSEKNPSLRFEYAGPCVVDLSNCSCSREANPVCGTDGTTYDNLCYMQCAKEKNNQIDMLHVGACEDNVQEATPADSCKCTRRPKPVCGTDGNTYRNPCMLNCARLNDPSLHIDHVGDCDNSVKVVEVAEIAQCTCTRNYSPVCSSNGVTFSNECIMRCAGTHLTVAKQGPCEILN